MTTPTERARWAALAVDKQMPLWRYKELAREAVPALLADVAERNERIAEFVQAWDAYVEATAGRGHRPESHDTELARILADPDAKPRHQWSSKDEQDACSRCGGAEYGTEANLHELVRAARAALEATR